MTGDRFKTNSGGVDDQYGDRLYIDTSACSATASAFSLGPCGSAATARAKTST